jgi:hypothetical protein
VLEIDFEFTVDRFIDDFPDPPLRAGRMLQLLALLVVDEISF